ncbi:NERD domain-containing protein [Paenibacillus sp. KN14-4R]|uniref:NERD domain-containing protein n=1 Tax=Paenibacillus sp. KN14-4R TaxID=3445773 RepID=UPI003FA032A6
MLYVYLLVMVAIIVILSSPKIKGVIGEKSVSYQLNKLDKEKYFILNDLVIPSSSGKTTQIDHVVVSPYGIFVIETKNYRGWILGNEDQQYWTQVIYKRKEKFYNPIRQNYGHIKALEAVLSKFDELPFFSIVSFSVRADLKVTVTSSEVIYTVKLLKTINKYKEKLLNKDDVQHIVEAINESSLKDKTAKKEHVTALKNEMAENANKIAKDECPKCDGKLVERSGKYGRFKGCVNFPKCRFVVK